MGLLDKLKTGGSTLTDLDGKTPAGFAPTAGTSKLHYEYSVNGTPIFADKPAPSTLDWDGKTPTVIGKFPYLDNLPE